ncbi:diguanylate cyclase [Shewanella algae]|nr:diguanylate cyclase [Shewanella algae]
MIRWTQLLQSLVADTKLGPQLQLWRSEPHSTPLALFMGCKIFAANQAALDYFACVHQEILDATLYDFAPRLQLGGQSSIELAKKLMQAAAASSQVQEWLHLNRHGKELPTRLYLEPVRIDSNKMILVRFEALDRRLSPRGEAQDVFGLLPRSVLAGILEESAEAVVISDTSGKILAVNRALCRLCGFSQAQLIGQQLQILETANDPKQRECRAALAQRDFWQGEVSHTRADGSHFPAWQSSRRLQTESGCYLVTIFSDISERKQLESRLTEQAMFDMLTGLPNRRHMKRKLRQVLSASLEAVNQGKPTTGALMFLDLNGFKHVNDSFGHSMGDRILQLVAARLEAGCIERADIARMGGDEFTLVLQDCRDREDIYRFAQQILALFETPFELEGQKFYLGTSIGISLFGNREIDPSELLSQADTAMYSAKRSASHINFYDSSMSEAAEHKLKLLGDLRHALGLGQLSLFYQPIVRLKDNHMAGAEALLRWHKSPHELLEAADFVPLLEETGLIVTVGNWVVEQACRQLAVWRQQDNDFIISVNVSPLQLEHLDFYQQVKSTLQHHQLPAEALILEITESALLGHPRQAKQTLKQLRALGVKIVLDDFGTGLSSLSRLGNLPLDGLKIAGEFAEQLEHQKGKRLCQAIVQLSQALELKFVAEGIETEYQNDMVRQMGDGLAQGFFFGYPLHPEQFTLAHFDL